MLLPLLLGCIAPTVVGVRHDGFVPDVGATEVQLAGGELLDGLGQSDWEIGPGVALSGAHTVADGVQVAGTAGHYLDAGTGGALELRRRLADGEAATLTGVVGGSGFRMQGGTWYAGVQTGLVLSRAFGPVRPYVGALLNPVLPLDSQVTLVGHASVGASWRPRLSDRVDGLVQVEGTWVRGPSYFGDDDAYDGRVVAATLGLTWTRSSP